jgi:hypothetical protein
LDLAVVKRWKHRGTEAQRTQRERERKREKERGKERFVTASEA